MFFSGQKLWPAIIRHSKLFESKSPKYFVICGISIASIYSYFRNDINTFCDELKDLSKRLITTTPETCLFIWGDNYYGISDPLSDSLSVKSPNVIKIPGTRSFNSLGFTIASFHEMQLSLKELSKLFGSRIKAVSMAQKHAACIDPFGNLIQWGHGFSGLISFIDDPPVSEDTAVLSASSLNEKHEHFRLPKPEEINRNPEATIVGHNLTLLATTINRVIAINDKGQLFLAKGIRHKPWESPFQIPSIKPTDSFIESIFSTFRGKSKYCAGSVTIYDIPFLSKHERVIQLASGDHHVVLLTSEGNVITMAVDTHSNLFGQLGYDPRDAREKNELKELLVFEPPSQVPPSDDNEMLQKAIKASDVFLTPNQEGISRKDSQHMRWREALTELKNTQVEELQNPVFWKLKVGSKVEQIAAGTHHTLLRTTSGQVWGFGANGYGQLGKNASIVNTIPLVITPCFSTPVNGIYAGGDSSAFLTQTQPENLSECYTMGAGMWGQLGNNTFRQYQSTMVPVTGISRLSYFNEAAASKSPIPIQSLSMGRTHIAAIVRTSVDNQETFPQFGFNVFTWGSNHAFQLGTGKRAMMSTPVQPNPLPSIKEKLLQEEVVEENSASNSSSKPKIGMQLFPGIVQKTDRMKYIVPPQSIVCGIDTTAIF